MLGREEMNTNTESIRRDLQWLRGEDGVVSAAEAESVLAKVLSPLFSAEGLELSTSRRGQDPQFDLVAQTPAGDADRVAVRVVIEYKHHGGGRPIEVGEVQDLIARVGSAPLYERAMLIGRFGFTASARERARRQEPVRIDLLDLNDVEAWIRQVEAGKPAAAEQIQLLIRSLSHEFAVLIASTADALDYLEWRDLERTVARVFEGLGFQTTLTPPSKDGGKDVILFCDATNGKESYIVELKHWRSGKGVGKQSVSDFLHVIVREHRSGGLFLSTSGFASDSFEGLIEVERSRLRFGDRDKIILLAKTYVKACAGLWSPPAALPEVLFDATE
jgi:restriction system protein